MALDEEVDNKVSDQSDMLTADNRPPKTGQATHQLPARLPSTYRCKAPRALQVKYRRAGHCRFENFVMLCLYLCSFCKHSIRAVRFFCSLRVGCAPLTSSSNAEIENSSDSSIAQHYHRQWIVIGGSHAPAQHSLIEACFALRAHFALEAPGASDVSMSCYAPTSASISHFLFSFHFVSFVESLL